MTFSIHVTVACAIVRARGVPVGKGDFLMHFCMPEAV